LAGNNVRRQEEDSYSKMNVTIHATNFDDAEKKYLNMGKSDGQFRMKEYEHKSALNMIEELDETIKNMYARDMNLVKRKQMVASPIRDWTSLGNNFENWVFERLPANVKKIVENKKGDVGVCVIPKHFMVRNKNISELEAVMDRFDSDTPFGEKVKKFMEDNYPQFEVLLSFRMLMTDKKNDMIMPTLTILMFEKKTE
jgi:hypothetical protein